VWARPPFAWIDDVETHPDFRLRGIARTMIFEACRRAASARCEWVLLTTDLFDTPKGMYRTLGFEPVGEVRGVVRESWRRAESFVRSFPIATPGLRTWGVRAP